MVHFSIRACVLLFLKRIEVILRRATLLFRQLFRIVAVEANLRSKSQAQILTKAAAEVRHSFCEFLLNLRFMLLLVFAIILEQTLRNSFILYSFQILFCTFLVDLLRLQLIMHILHVLLQHLLEPLRV